MIGPSELLDPTSTTPDKVIIFGPDRVPPAYIFPCYRADPWLAAIGKSVERAASLFLSRSTRRESRSIRDIETSTGRRASGKLCVVGWDWIFPVGGCCMLRRYYVFRGNVGDLRVAVGLMRVHFILPILLESVAKETRRLWDFVSHERKNKFVLEIFFQPDQTSAEPVGIPELIPSQLDSSSKDWLPFLLDCAGTPSWS